MHLLTMNYVHYYRTGIKRTTMRQRNIARHPFGLLIAIISVIGDEQKTRNDSQNPKTTVIGKKVGKKIKPGDKLQVRNPNGSVSRGIHLHRSVSGLIRSTIARFFLTWNNRAPLPKPDVRVVQRGQDLSFTLETRQALGVLSEAVRKRLHGDFTVQSGVTGPIHFTHTTSRAARGCGSEGFGLRS